MLFSFGLFEFDAATGELRRERNLVHLQSQPAQVLGTLLQHRGEVVSRDALRRTVWPDGTYVDFERGLNFCIAQVRSALNDDAAEPRFIRTIPKRGYQFIAPVRTQGHEEQPVLGKENSRLAKAVVIAASACFAVAALLAATYWLRAQSDSRPIVAVLRFDNETGNPDVTRFSDAVTDMLVAELTSRADGHYRVIGNARILRLPREQRDLTAVRSSLGATYVILGQVQNAGTETRVLAHLIHLPDQTHVWVTRIDRNPQDPLGVELQIAQTVAGEFSPRIRKSYTALVSHSRASL